MRTKLKLQGIAYRAYRADHAVPGQILIVRSVQVEHGARTAVASLFGRMVITEIVVCCFA